MAVLDSKGELTIYFSFICLIKKKRKKENKRFGSSHFVQNRASERERDRLSF